MLVLSAAIVAAAILVAAALQAWQRRATSADDFRGWLERLEVEPVLVELDGKTTIAGLLASVDDTAIVLRQARVLGGTLAMPMAGDVVIPRARIRWIQTGVTIDDSATARLAA